MLLKEVGRRAGRRRAGGEVGHLAVLHAVFGDAADFAGAIRRARLWLL
jgi:hypothetical protein